MSTTIDPNTHASHPGRSRRLGLASRSAAGLLGGYAAAWGVAASGTSLLYAAGMGFHDAEFLASLFGVLVFLCGFLWAVASRRAWRPWAVLGGGGAVLTVVASLVQSTQV